MSQKQSETTVALIGRLEGTATNLSRIFQENPDTNAWLRRDDDAWSPREVLVHLRASDEILTPRIYQILARDNPYLLAFDVVRWAEVAGYHAIPYDALYSRIVIQRFELIRVLRSLPEIEWGRIGSHEDLGEITVADIVTHLVEHAEEHIDQIRQTLEAGGVASSG